MRFLTLRASAAMLLACFFAIGPASSESFAGRLAGDFDLDGKIDIQDVVAMKQNWRYGTPDWPDCEPPLSSIGGGIDGDVDEDGDVDASDFAYLMSNLYYGTSHWRGGNPIRLNDASDWIQSGGVSSNWNYGCWSSGGVSRYGDEIYLVNTEISSTYNGTLDTGFWVTASPKGSDKNPSFFFETNDPLSIVTPEPGTWAMLMGGAVLLWCLRRRK